MLALKSEFRKLISVRSTYVVFLVALAILGLFAFYIEGLRAGVSVNDPGKLASEVMGAVMFTGVLVMIAGALIMTHEYRYNTIVYSLTASKTRLRVLLAKILVVSLFSIAFAIVIGVLSPLLTYLGISIKGLHLAPQALHFGDLLLRTAFAGWAYGMFGLLFATLIRNQVGTMISILLVPSTVEQLLGILLKNNAVYLPFSALSAVTQNIAALSHTKAAFVVTAYIVVGWMVAAVLFLRRDAN